MNRKISEPTLLTVSVLRMFWMLKKFVLEKHEAQKYMFGEKQLGVWEP